MTLKLYMHPLSSFCHKVLVALYENSTSFEPVIVDFSNPDSRAAFIERSPRGKMPALHDIEANVTLPESSVIIEYIHTQYQGPAEMLPKGVEVQLEVRLWDRFFDLYIHQPMQRVVAERLRPKDAPDPRGLSKDHRPSKRPVASWSNTWQVVSGSQARSFRWRIALRSRRSSTARSFIRSAATLKTPASISNDWFQDLR